VFNREKILELELQCKSLKWQNETYKETLKELDELKAAKKRIEAEFFTPEEAGGVYDELRKNGVDIIDMEQPVSFFGGKFGRPYFTLSQTIEYKDLQKIISEAGWEMYDFSVNNGRINFSIKKPEAHT